MFLINSLTSDPMQQFTLTGISGVQIGVSLRFMPRIQIWNMDVTYADFIAQGIPVLASPNLLRQWRNIIPFGLACIDINRLDPYTVNDFADGTALLYLLNSADVAAVEAQYYS